MATQFQSAQTRSLWTGIIFGFATDYLLAVVAARIFFADQWSGALLFGGGLLLALYAINAVYSMICAARYWLAFALFDRKQRVESLLKTLSENDFPTPEEYYTDPAAYLDEIGSSPETLDRTRFTAGALFGALDVLATVNRPLARMTAYICLEQALQEYSRRRRI